MKTQELDPEAEDYQYLKRYGTPMPNLSALTELCRNKIGLLFTDEPAFEIKPVVESNKI